jgi:hypothetical protein
MWNPFKKKDKVIINHARRIIEHRESGRQLAQLKDLIARGYLTSDALSLFGYREEADGTFKDEWLPIPPPEGEK